jgi:hypothetical protein
VFQECEIKTTTSFSQIIHKSPCIASEGHKKNEDVPVEDNVADIFRAIIPDFQTQQEITFHLQSNIFSTILQKSSSIILEQALIPLTVAANVSLTHLELKVFARFSIF